VGKTAGFRRKWFGDESEFETWPATPVDASLKVDELLKKPDLTKLLCYAKEQPGSVGHPTHCRFPIANF
jgi:hypothetical protein